MVRVSLVHVKGQVISKGLFGILGLVGFFQKTKKQIRFYLKIVMVYLQFHKYFQLIVQQKENDGEITIHWTWPQNNGDA